MSYVSDYKYSGEDLNNSIKDEKSRIRDEIKQAIENGLIKIESGSEKLFEILS